MHCSVRNLQFFEPRSEREDFLGDDVNDVGIFHAVDESDDGRMTQCFYPFDDGSGGFELRLRRRLDVKAEYGNVAVAGSSFRLALVEAPQRNALQGIDDFADVVIEIADRVS